jgi:hypothetical protein
MRPSQSGVVSLSADYTASPKQRSRSDGSLMHLLSPGSQPVAHGEMLSLKRPQASDGSLMHLLRPDAPCASSSQASLMHLLRPDAPCAPSSQASLMHLLKPDSTSRASHGLDVTSTNPATVTLHEWANWNAVEMQRIQAHAVGSTRSDGVSFALLPRSASLPCTPELKRSQRAECSPLVLPAADVESVGAEAQSFSGRSHAKPSAPTDEPGFHFDKGDILGMLRF